MRALRNKAGSDANGLLSSAAGHRGGEYLGGVFGLGNGGGGSRFCIDSTVGASLPVLEQLRSISRSGDKVRVGSRV